MSTSGALAPMTRRVRMTQACLAGIALGSLIAGSLPPRSYTKDLQEPYLTARALRDGIDIYTPVNELAARYFPTAADTFPHPDPHPPVLAGAVVAAGQLVNLATVGPAGFVRYYFDVLPSVAALYEHLGLNSSPHGALLRVFGGAADVSPIVHAPNVVLPATIAIALVAMAALALLDPEASPVAALVGLPVVWYYYAPLALPQILILLRSAAFRRATLVAVAAMSFSLPLVNVLVQWC